MGVVKRPTRMQRGNGQLWFLVLFLILISVSVAYSIITALPLLTFNASPLIEDNPADIIRDKESHATNINTSTPLAGAAVEKTKNKIYRATANSIGWATKATETEEHPSRPIYLGQQAGTKDALIIEEDDYSLSGRVLSHLGEPLAHIPVLAVGESDGEMQTFSASDGRYHFPVLNDLRYEVRVETNDFYRGTRIAVPVGIHSADLIVTMMNEVLIIGRITDTNGSVVENARIFQSDLQIQSTYSDSNGDYSLPLATTGQGPYGLGFKARGFRPRYAQIKESDWDEYGYALLDVALEPINELTNIHVRVTNHQQRPVADELVQLHSPELKRTYQGVSDEQGQVAFQKVEPGDDYILLVRPVGQYKNYTLNGISISDSTPELEIKLESNALATLEGTMVDMEGNPIPDFQLLIRNRDAGGEMLAVVGDNWGRFNVKDIPSGELIFESRASPYLTIRGIHAESDKTNAIELPMDWGRSQLLGQVLDAQGAPLAGSSVQLTMDRYINGVRSHSTRTAITDINGRFIFTRLGRGLHTLVAQARSFETVSLDHTINAPSDSVLITMVPSNEKET